jgi:hypothetical protein
MSLGINSRIFGLYMKIEAYVDNHPLSPSTKLKIEGVLFGFFLAMAAITCHLLHVNAIDVYTIGLAGGALVVGAAFWAIFDCRQEYYNYQ